MALGPQHTLQHAKTRWCSIARPGTSATTGTTLADIRAAHHSGPQHPCVEICCSLLYPTCNLYNKLTAITAPADDAPSVERQLLEERLASFMGTVRVSKCVRGGSVVIIIIIINNNKVRAQHRNFGNSVV